ncbi:MAG TPA: hypothetical protein VJ820_17615 [Propionibacteriaceae bacterium]|nr:hypothetical protein [Propionibacteriaceae bacterium]
MSGPVGAGTPPGQEIHTWWDGIALLGSVTATIASWLVEQVDRVVEERETADMRTQMELLNIKIDQLLGERSEASRLTGTEP